MAIGDAVPACSIMNDVDEAESKNALALVTYM